MTSIYIPPIAAWLLDCAAAYAVVIFTGVAWVKLSERFQRRWIAGIGTAGAFVGLMLLYSPIRDKALAIECWGSRSYYDCTHPEPSDY